jgi:hypothetical protein
MNGDLPDIEGIFEGTEREIPKTSDSMYAVVNSMCSYAKDHRYETEKIANSLIYIEKFPADYIAILLENYSNIEENYARDVLVQIPEYNRLISKKGTMRNGVAR